MSGTSGKRLSICYAAPGQNLLPTAGPTRNVLSVAACLSQWADVTVAFRQVLTPVAPTGYRVITIDPPRATAARTNDDTATRGLHPLAHLAYCRTLRAFAVQQAANFDVVLEKGWRLSGFLSAAFQRAGVPAILVENAVGLWMDPVNDATSAAKYVLHRAATAVTNACSRGVPIVIAETDQLKAMLVTHRGISPDRIRVIGLGVDHGLFRPADQYAARDALGINTEPTVVLYVGGIDEYHDLEPVIEAVQRVGNPSIELHVVGDGAYRARAEAAAATGPIRCVFHGHVPHADVPRYIAAADLCIAPYRTSAFHDGTITFSTLKIPEYMSCARPVASIPGPAIGKLITDGVNGFMFANDLESWKAFLETSPSRPRLAAMGRAAAEAVSSLGWDTTARKYLELCEELAATRPGHRLGA